MKKSLLIGTITLLTLGSGPALADQVGTLNTFTAGQPAVAADVNENFTDIKDAVNSKADQTDVDANTGAITDLQNNKLNSSALGTALGSTSTPGGNSIDGNAAAIAGKAAAIHTHAGEDITSGTVAEARIDADITRDSEVAGFVNSLSIDADTLQGFPATAFADTLITDALDARLDVIEAGACPSDMVSVGSVCIDKYEASVWSAPTGGTQYGDTNGSTGSLEGGAIPCSQNGNNCANTIFARSVTGVAPTGDITWFQAQLACANVGKRLPTNAEWQMAAAGTTDLGNTAAGDAIGSGSASNPQRTTCNTQNLNDVSRFTGTGTQCVSSWGAQDMVGNMAEWVADWVQGAFGGNPTDTNTAAFGLDGGVGIWDATAQFNGAGFPPALVRGGDGGDGNVAGVFNINAENAPSNSEFKIGFRCAK